MKRLIVALSAALTLSVSLPALFQVGLALAMPIGGIAAGWLCAELALSERGG